MPQVSSNLSSADQTRLNIIRAAEHLFAENGFRAMTLRDVTREAEVNLAAVNYHFGSKSELMRAVLSQRFNPINEERIRRLEALVNEHAPDTIPLRSIVAALIEPLFDSNEGATGPDPALMRIIARGITEPADFIRPLHEEFFAELTRRFLVELKRSCPDVSEEQLRLRLYLTVSTMIGSIVHHVCLERISEGKFSGQNLDHIVGGLINFVVAGLESN